MSDIIQGHGTTVAVNHIYRFHLFLISSHATSGLTFPPLNLTICILLSLKPVQNIQV